MRATVIGLGYVGLPLAIRLSQIGLIVSGVDINENKIKKLQKNILPFAEDEPNLKSFLKKETKKGNISFSTHLENIEKSKFVFVAVDTPVKNKVGNYTALISAISEISKTLKIGQVIIIESTIAPTTSKKILIPLIEKISKLKINKDFYLAVVPERIRPNYIFKQLTERPRTVGLSTPKIEKRLKYIYSKITNGDLDFVDLTTAETVKTVENTYRDVNIAFANEVALACEELNVNVWKVIELVNKDPFKSMLQPGAGVGGHCIPKDPWLLASSVSEKNFKIVKSARNINDSMPEHIYKLAVNTLKDKGKDLKKCKISILGYSYLENSDDVRNSPTEKLVNKFKKNKIKYIVHDPIVKDFNVNIHSVLKDSDCLVVMVAHNFYKKLNFNKLSSLMKTKIIIDGRNSFDKKYLTSLGFTYKGIGNV